MAQVHENQECHDKQRDGHHYQPHGPTGLVSSHDTQDMRWRHDERVSEFREMDHPRGRPGNSGQFAEKERSARDDEAARDLRRQSALAIHFSYLETIYSHLIMHGGVIRTPPERRHPIDSDYLDYYNASVAVDYDATLEACHRIEEVGVDWEECTDPASHVGEGFGDTENNLRFNYLIGTVVLNDGTEYLWGANVADDEENIGGELSFSRVMRMIRTTPPMDEVLSGLKHRLGLDDPDPDDTVDPEARLRWAKRDFGMSHNCTIPEIR